MSKTLEPGDIVICQVKSYVTRRAEFVRYIKPKSFPRAERRHCLVQFKHTKFPTRIESRLVKKEEP